MWDINNKTSDIINVTKIKNTNGENWSQIKYLNENTLFYVNNISFALNDLRENLLTTKLLTEFNLQTFLKRHEYEIFTNSCIKNEYNIYFTTNKQIVEYDLRNEKIINTWTHLLKESIFLTDNSDNLLLVATENYNERLVVGSDFESLRMPLLAKNLNDSFDDCILTDNKIDLAYLIRERNSFSTTGIKLLKNDKDYSIFTSNSVGDIYVNDFYENNFDSSEILNRNLCEFKKLNDTMISNFQTTNPLYYQDKVWIKSIKHVLRSDEPKQKDMMNEKRQFYLEKKKNELRRDVDKCKSFLYDVWDNDGPISKIAEIESNLNVQMWLSNINENDVDNNLEESNNLVTNNEVAFDELHESVSQFV